MVHTQLESFECILIGLIENQHYYLDLLCSWVFDGVFPKLKSTEKKDLIATLVLKCH